MHICIFIYTYMYLCACIYVYLYLKYLNNLENQTHNFIVQIILHLATVEKMDAQGTMRYLNFTQHFLLQELR